MMHTESVRDGVTFLLPVKEERGAGRVDGVVRVREEGGGGRVDGIEVKKEKREEGAVLEVVSSAAGWKRERDGSEKAAASSKE